MIDLTVDAPYEESALCGCGDAECLGPADAVIPVVEALAASLPQLESPMLRLIQERNEARELVKRMHAAVNVDSVGEEYYSAMLEAHRAISSWKGGAK
jgi:hypothetical protein